MERKEFLSLVGISVGAVILQNCISGCSSKSDPTPSGNNGGSTSGGGTTTVTGLTGNATASKGTIDFTLDLTASDFATLKDNGKALIVGDVIVAKTKTGDYIAVAKACTHEGTTINFLSDQNKFKCPNHGSEFDTSGSVLLGPAATALKQYKASFDTTKSILSIKA
ncbi:QcrA and Rieske domain-containing protein [Flectobacillus major]|jgi:cytochrome b6-f complex iron-sulfur subunit|uniref:QcrA and Rieske domain-containing protein n=1 Tax=Flectobacillus major TaxID=103 RepID=UPI0004038F43|nr:Rieske 2Fe-2S domain-containing protein [Flectobacillus major]